MAASPSPKTLKVFQRKTHLRPTLELSGDLTELRSPKPTWVVCTDGLPMLSTRVFPYSPFFKDWDLNDIQSKGYSPACNLFILLPKEPRVISSLHKYHFFTEIFSSLSVIPHQIVPRIYVRNYMRFFLYNGRYIFNIHSYRGQLLLFWNRGSLWALNIQYHKFFLILLNLFWALKIPPEDHGIVCYKTFKIKQFIFKAFPITWKNRKQSSPFIVEENGNREVWWLAEDLTAIDFLEPEQNTYFNNACLPNGSYIFASQHFSVSTNQHQCLGFLCFNPFWLKAQHSEN